MKKLALVLSLCFLIFIVACSSNNKSKQVPGIIENIENNELSIGPLEQDPEEQYSLLKVKYDNDTKVSGDITEVDMLKQGDSVEITIDEKSNNNIVKIAKKIKVDRKQ